MINTQQNYITSPQQSINLKQRWLDIIGIYLSKISYKLWKICRQKLPFEIKFCKWMCHKVLSNLTFRYTVLFIIYRSCVWRVYQATMCTSLLVNGCQFWSLSHSSIMCTRCSSYSILNCVEFREWMSKYIPQIVMDVITYSCHNLR